MPGIVAVEGRILSTLAVSLKLDPAESEIPEVVAEVSRNWLIVFRGLVFDLTSYDNLAGLSLLELAPWMAFYYWLVDRRYHRTKSTPLFFPKGHHWLAHSSSMTKDVALCITRPWAVTTDRHKCLYERPTGRKSYFYPHNMFLRPRY